jgi:arginase
MASTRPSRPVSRTASRGGLTVREVLDLVHSIGGRIVGADVVELNPGRDVQDLTVGVAAKIVRELASEMLAA